MINDPRAAALHEKCLKKCFGRIPPPGIRDSFRKCLAPTLTHLEDLDQVMEFRRQIAVEANLFNVMSGMTTPEDRSTYMRVRGSMVADELSNAIYKMDMLGCTSKCPDRGFVPVWIRGALSTIGESALLGPLRPYFYLLGASHLGRLRDWPQVEVFAAEGINKVEAEPEGERGQRSCSSELHRMLALAHMYQGRMEECGKALNKALKIAMEDDEYIPALRLLLFRTLGRYHNSLNNEQEVQRWRREVEALFEKHTEQELANRDEDVPEGGGVRFIARRKSGLN